MLYALIGNGNANPIEIQATLESLRSAVAEPDEFWMLLMDMPDLSDTVKHIVGWLDDEALYYEVVVSEGVDINPDLKNADETHDARRPLDYLIRLTKHRVQPGESSALLVLSDDLDNDDVALYAIERGIAEGLPVFDLKGQMTSIVMDEEDIPPAAIPDVVEIGPLQVVPDPEPTTNGEAPLIDTQLHEQAVLENETSGLQQLLEAEKMRPQAAPLSYTRAELDELTRDELKNLVKIQGVTPSDMRSKSSMADALMQALEEQSIQRGIDQAAAGDVVDLGSFAEDVNEDAQVVTFGEPDIEGKDIQPAERVERVDLREEFPGEYTVVPTAVSDEFRQQVLDLGPSILKTYLIHVVSTGTLLLQEIPPAKLPVIETLLAEE